MKRIPKNIPKDVLFNIFSRLALKHLSRLKCVNQYWRSLIQYHLSKARYHKNFIKIRHSYSDAGYYHAEFYSIDIDGTASTFFHSFSQDYEFETISLCNGLLCFISIGGKIGVCNPAREETIILPKTTLLRRYNYPMIGLGFDPATEKYKVVVWDTAKLTKAEIFTLGTKSGSWRGITRPTDYTYAYHSHYMPVHINGVLYWYSSNKFICFNLTEEKFKVLSVPGNLRDELQGQGLLCELDWKIYDPLVKMWILTNHDTHVLTMQKIMIKIRLHANVQGIRNNGTSMRPCEKAGDRLICCVNEQDQVITTIRVGELPGRFTYACAYQFCMESRICLRSLT